METKQLILHIFLDLPIKYRILKQGDGQYRLESFSICIPFLCWGWEEIIGGMPYEICVNVMNKSIASYIPRKVILIKKG